LIGLVGRSGSISVERPIHRVTPRARSAFGIQ
jgi:hypothetical protein